MRGVGDIFASESALKWAGTELLPVGARARHRRPRLMRDKSLRSTFRRHFSHKSAHTVSRFRQLKGHASILTKESLLAQDPIIRDLTLILSIRY
ncbi:hypothetical protein PoB_006611100 [Plakobranchus ocellatus]|uniref:Uncharacterized protein n=1 Tax=Plakobranchus ocellatus TaxID=259542 RepID=A0AAV4D6C2_9GAST|nr:hypothetical protein PoB_006611100 [Plakobranchus ocellatus]